MKAPPSGVAAAVAALTGEPHPLARPRPPSPRQRWAPQSLRTGQHPTAAVPNDHGPHDDPPNDAEAEGNDAA
jgi:hypothetical protein